METQDRDESRSSLPATPKQTWYLFTLTKKDYRDARLTRADAAKMIDSAKKSQASQRTQQGQLFQQILDEAIAAGMAAGQRKTPIPMVVEQHSSPLDDNSPVEQQWTVPDGVCGFAWVRITPATCSFVKFLKSKNMGSYSDYQGGWIIWVQEFNQSYERKMAYADAFAGVIQHYIKGVSCYASGRLD